MQFFSIATSLALVAMYTHRELIILHIYIATNGSHAQISPKSFSSKYITIGYSANHLINVSPKLCMSI